MRILPVIIATAALPAIMAMSTYQDPQTTRPSTTQDPSRATSTSESDRLLATWLLVGNNNEIAIAQLAQQRAQDTAVKQFAQKMIDDHRKIGEKLQPFAANVDFDSPPVAGEERAQGRPQEAGTARPPMAGQLDHIALIKDLGKQCYESSRRELDQKQGAEFDRCFMGMAVGAHMHANDMMTVFQKHSTGPLKEVIADGQKTVALHLEHAKDLCKKLESKSTTAGE